MTIKDNLVLYMENLNANEIKIILEALKETYPNAHEGNLPFFDRQLVYDRLDTFYAMAQNGSFSMDMDGRELMIISELLTKLDIGDPWIDITTIGDQQRVYMHKITSERKREDFGDDFF